MPVVFSPSLHHNRYSSYSEILSGGLGSWVLGPGFLGVLGVLGSGSWIVGPGFWILGSGSWGSWVMGVLGPGFWGSWVLGPGS